MSPKARRTELALSPARKDTLLRRFEANAGRNDLREALEWSGDPRAWALLSMLADPAYRKHSFARLCEKTGLRYRDVIDIFRWAKLDEAMILLLKHLPAVAQGNVIDAMAHMEACKRCEGTGMIHTEDEPEAVRCCYACEGSGKVRVPGDEHAKRLVCEIAGLIGGKARRRS